MLNFSIPKLSCGHCVRAVTEAVQELDPAAKVDVDLAAKRVAIATTADSAQVMAKLAEAGYPAAAA